MHRLRQHINSFKPYIIERTIAGATRKILIADSLGQGWYDKNLEVPPEILFLKNKKLSPGAIVFDVGAHQGIVGMMLAQVVGKSGKVVCIEANNTMLTLQYETWN